MQSAVFGIEVELKSYIAHPYWPEREKLINIIKESGVSRARTTESRARALDGYLRSKGMTREDYDRLEKLADRPFYTDDNDLIVVPALHVTSMIVNAVRQASASVRPFKAEQARSLMRATSWNTDRDAPDGTWERFVVLTGGTGMKLSNQRALRVNEYIGSPPDAEAQEPVLAAGRLFLAPGVNPAKMYDLLSYAGSEIGIGAARKMGWGRFMVTEFSAEGTG
jgi:hypothetical protein